MNFRKRLFLPLVIFLFAPVFLGLESANAAETRHSNYTQNQQVNQQINQQTNQQKTPVAAKEEKKDEKNEEVEEEAFVKKSVFRKIDMTKWQFNKEKKIFYQLGIQYCRNPKNPYYERLSIYVPECYFDARKNKDGTYTVLGTKEVKFAPIYVLSIDTKTEKQRPDIRYSPASEEYTKYKRVVIRAGGEDTADFKAALRYVQWNSDLLPEGAGAIYVYGENVGGGYACVLGVTGNLWTYREKLDAIGAVRTSDSVPGVYAINPALNFGRTSDKALDIHQLEYSIDRLFSMGEFPIQTKLHATSMLAEPSDELSPSIKEMFTREYERSVKKEFPGYEIEDAKKKYSQKRNAELKGRFDTRKAYADALNTLTMMKWLEYNQWLQTAKIVDMEGFHRLLKHIQMNGAEKRPVAPESLENPILLLNDYPEARRARYWVVRSDALKSLDESAKEQDLVDALKDANLEVFFDLKWK
ncbi:MAG: hypothetical protein K6B43_14605 [Treponema sp.]|nr:hypothetical protein [Treponema sp.]